MFLRSKTFCVTTIFIFIALILFGCVTANAESEWAPLKDRLAQDGLPSEYLEVLFERSSVNFDPSSMSRKMNRLLEKRISKRENPGAVVSEDTGIHEHFVDYLHLAGAYAFMNEHREILGNAKERYHVPPEIVTALLLIETRFGRDVGDHSALITLSSMALCRDTALIRPHIKRKTLSEEDEAWLEERTIKKADWAYRELLALILHARATGRDPLNMNGSVYGALGMCQFMPSNIPVYGADGDGDGVTDLANPADAIHSVAKYLNENGWEAEMTKAEREKALYSYNHSNIYVRTILAVAEKLVYIDASFGPVD